MADFGRELLRRRVPQIVGAYLAGGWILLEFTDWTVNRYVLSSHVTDFVVASWLLLLPAVAILAWNHGSPGRDEWKRSETIGIALNLILAGGILLAVFRGQDLGAATTSVVVQDDEGNELTREIPKAEFRRRVALFSFVNGSGDPELDWLQYAFPQAISIDMAQDPFVRSLADIRREKEGADPERPLALPLAQRREIAGQLSAETFVTGVLDRTPDGFEVRFTVHDTERGRPIAEHILSGADPMELADQVSLQIRRDLAIPTGHLDSTPDLPVRELLSENDEALRPFFAGAFYNGIDVNLSRASLIQATRIDSTFARANWILGDLLFAANDLDGALEAERAAIRHDFRLDESARFALKTAYYLASQEPERALSVARLHTELYPYETDAYWLLGLLLERRGEDEAAVEAFERVIELDPFLIQAYRRIGDIRLDDGRFDEAEESYRKLLELNAESAPPHLMLGKLYLTAGRFDEAEAEYERAQILDPTSSYPSIGLARTAMFQGRFEEAEDRLTEAREFAAGDLARKHALEELRRYLDLRGRADTASIVMREIAALTGRSEGRLAELQLLGYVAVYRTRAGDTTGAFSLLDSVRAELEPPLDAVAEIAETQVHRELGNSAELAAGVPVVRDLLASFGIEGEEWWGDLLEAESMRLDGRCEEALPLYRSAAETIPTPYLFDTIREMGADPFTTQAACLAELDRADEAESLLQQVLQRIPAEPTAQLELARIAVAEGSESDARQALDAALVTWAEADSSYEPAAEARELRAALEE